MSNIELNLFLIEIIKIKEILIKIKNKLLLLFVLLTPYSVPI